METLLALLMFWAPQPVIQFSHADARTLVRNAPQVNELAESCIVINENHLPNDEGVVLFMVYSKCGKPAVSSLVGGYYVDLRTGDVRLGAPENEPEQSERLKRVRESLLQKKAKAKTPNNKAKKN